MKTKPTLEIIFRTFGTSVNDVIALFPNERNGEWIGSYMHIGQHSDASADLINELSPVSEEMYAKLLNEIKQIYNDHDVKVLD